MMDTPSVLLPTCANWAPGKSVCQRQGRKACGNCKLVVYCEAECQKAHWPEHKKACKSPLGKEGWLPAWDLEGRVPHWATGVAATNGHNEFGGGKYLWGNTPALDVLKLGQNEGVGYSEDIALLFAASGDLRHVVKTIANLPSGMTQQISVTMNDREFDVVARNTILLLLALTPHESTSIGEIEAPLSSAETLIHVWYSASIPSSAVSQLQSRIKPLIEEVCSNIADKSSNTTISNTWEFSGGRTLHLELKKKDWLRLRKFLDTPAGMTIEDATRIRTAVTLAPERADYRDRWYFKDVSPFMRIAKRRFREDGLLLPFGHPRVAFNTPNPTLLQDFQTWPMSDTADPSSGWPILEVHQILSPALRDWYGKLFIFLESLIGQFLDRVKETRISFDLYNVDVNELPKHLELNKYSRVEVANISDAGYVGIRNTLSLLAPLLQPQGQNPHATFITLFINAVKEIVQMSGKETPDMGVITKFLPFPQISPQMTNGAEMLRIWDARDLAIDVDNFFGRYMAFMNFEQISTDLRVKMKRSNTVTEKWPTRSRLQPWQKGAEEEFRLYLGSSLTNIERYVEWSRVE